MLGCGGFGSEVAEFACVARSAAEPSTIIKRTQSALTVREFGTDSDFLRPMTIEPI